jgi:hypothetical protein
MVVEVGTGAPLQMPPSEARSTDAPRMQVREGDALAFVSAPTRASSFAFGSSVKSFSSAAFADVVAPTRLRLQRVCSPRRRTLLRLHRDMELAAVLWPSASRPPSLRHAAAGAAGAGTWSPAALGLVNGVRPGAGLLGDSSDEDARGGSGSGRQ